MNLSPIPSRNIIISETNPPESSIEISISLPLGIPKRKGLTSIRTCWIGSKLILLMLRIVRIRLRNFFIMMLSIKIIGRKSKRKYNFGPLS